MIGVLMVIIAMGVIATAGIILVSYLGVNPPTRPGTLQPLPWWAGIVFMTPVVALAFFMGRENNE